MNRRKNPILFIVAGMLFLAVCFTCCKKKEARQTVAIIEKTDSLTIGRYLFYDRRLSYNATKSCGTCHNPDFAFTDGYKRSFGVYADFLQRNSLPLFNLRQLKYFTSSDSSLHTVLQQMNNPLYNRHPPEMDVAGHEAEILKRVQAEPLYQQLFQQYFGNTQSINWQNIKQLVGDFELSIQSYNAPYDRFLKGDSNALTATQKKGRQLFYSARFNCGTCHGGINFSTPAVTDAAGNSLFYFNTGLYNTDGKGSYPAYDQGLFDHTKNIKDMGRFRVPTLRNLVFTAPYFHDGSALTIADAVDAFLNGGRKISQGEYRGDGRKNQYKHASIQQTGAIPEEKQALISFLYSLTDSSLISNPAYRNPFQYDETKKKY